MTDRITKKIIKECTKIEQEASQLYESFVSLTDKKRLQKFWNQMAEDEKEHITFWESLIDLARKNRLPQILENPEETLSELEGLNAKIDLFKELFAENPSSDSAFLLAYRIEFFLLHPVFATFFKFMQPIKLGVDPAEKYDEHLRMFVDAVAKYGSKNPELDLLGETLQSMWKRNIKLAEQSSMDFLTGIYNRYGFFTAVKPLSHLSQRNNQNVGLMIADVDDFKEINDRLGHDAGDKVLKKVAAIMKSSVRTSDLVGRYGGEEFIVFLSTVDRNSIKTLAEKVRRNVEAKMKGSAHVTVSIGIADSKLARDVDEDLKKLIKRADKSLYHAKRSGKNRVSYYRESSS